MLYIIVTYNGEKYIKRCIQSITDHNPDSEIWIHDNGSTDGTVSTIEGMGIKPVITGTNLGFGAANNLGLNYFLNSDHEACFLLNQDAYLTESTNKAFSLLNSQPNSILAPLQLTGSATNFDSHFKHSYLQNKDCPDFLEDVYFSRVRDTYPISFAPAAAWIIPKSVINKVGGFNPSFFHYGEDANYIQRCEFHGVKLYLTPQAIVLHDRENRSNNSVHKTIQKQVERKLILQLSNPRYHGSGIKSSIYAAARIFTKYPLTIPQLNKIQQNRTISQKKGTCFL